MMLISNCGRNALTEFGLMNSNHNIPPHVIAVGSRVRVAESGSTDSPSPDDETHTGVVLEDYKDMVIDPSSVGRDWARVHRWAIALDDGRLIFANDNDLTAESPTSS